MTPTQLEAILAEREACAVTAGKLVRFDRKGADAQQRARADAFQSGQRYAAEQIRNRPTPASEEVGEAERIATEIERIATIAVSDSGQRISSHWLLSEARALLVALARP